MNAFTGLTDDMIAMYKGKKTTLVYSNTADAFTCDAGMEGVGSKVYTCKFGESYETVGLDGSPATVSKTQDKYESTKIQIEIRGQTYISNHLEYC